MEAGTRVEDAAERGGGVELIFATTRRNVCICSGRGMGVFAHVKR